VLLDYAQGLLDALRSASDLLEEARGGLQALLEGGLPGSGKAPTAAA